MEISKLDPMLTAAFIAISGHMGTRIIFMLESYLVKKFGFENQCDITLKEDKNHGY